MEVQQLLSVKQRIFLKVYSTKDYNSLVELQPCIIDNRKRCEYNKAKKRVRGIIIKEPIGKMTHSYISSQKYHFLKMYRLAALKKLGHNQIKPRKEVYLHCLDKFLGVLYCKQTTN